MAVITVAEVKTILGVTSTADDAKIAAFIPYVQDDIAAYCNNRFADTSIYRKSGSDLEFVNGSSRDYITDAQDWFSTSGFKDGMDVVVVGGSNEGFYTISSVSTGTMKMTSSGEFVNQSQTTYHRWPGFIGVYRVKWPRDLKLQAAKMVKYLIDHPTESDAKSESLDDYSVTFAGQNAYPERLIAGLKKYRKVVLV
jgi:hypothetical protein